MSLIVLILTPWILFQSIFLCDTFNLDVYNPVVYKSNQINTSYFGYSLAVHQYNGINELLVGAPRDASSGNPTGALYQCRRNGFTFSCSKANVQGATQTDQWLGATVVSKNGAALVCAPRSGLKARGQCYYGQGDLTSFAKYIVLSDGLLGGTDYGEVGFSATFSLDGNHLYTGGPSCESNKGQLFGNTTLINTSAALNYYMDKSIDISYFTYAMAPGKVLNNGKEGLAVSVGFHQNSKFAGKVILLDATDKVRVSSSLVGHQPGENFGGALAVTDINNDGRDDLIIGAPFYTEFSNAGVRFELGAVYVYLQTSPGTFQQEVILHGKATGGRFGYSVVALGDANADGYNDIAIGAPYDNSGTAYIYYGFKDGLRSEPGQIISGNDFSPPIVASFGFSHAAYDFDGNKYSDLFVGAYKSDSIVYLPARPVVRVASQLSFNPEYITLEKKDCTTTGSQPTPVSCVKLSYCLTYTGVGVPASVIVRITISLDVTQLKSSRLLFLDTNGSQQSKDVTLQLNQRQCQDTSVFVRPDIRDKLSPMEVTLTTALVQNLRPPPLSPILDIYEGNGMASNSLSIFKDCGPDLVCIPDLQLTVTTNLQSFIQGSGESLNVDVKIYNAGEDAFGSEFYLELPNTLSYNKADRDATDASILCFPPSEVSGPVVRCEIGNPLQSRATAQLRIILQPIPKDDITSITFLAKTNSTNKENNNTLTDNNKTLSLKFEAKASLQLSGWFRPESLSVNATALKEEGVVPPYYTHFYELKNIGPSDVLSARLHVITPTETPEGYAITELTEQPVVEEGFAECDLIPLQSKVIIINCWTTERIQPNKRFVVKLSSRLSKDALINQLNRDSFELTSVISGNVTAMPFGQGGFAVDTARVTLVVTKIDRELNLLQATPWWVAVVSAVGAVLVLAIIVAVLHKFGFFKRNRPPMSATLQTAESQPLQERERPSSERDNTVDEDSDNE